MFGARQQVGATQSQQLTLQLEWHSWSLRLRSSSRRSCCSSCSWFQRNWHLNCFLTSTPHLNQILRRLNSDCCHSAGFSAIDIWLISRCTNPGENCGYAAEGGAAAELSSVQLTFDWGTNCSLLTASGHLGLCRDASDIFQCCDCISDTFSQFPCILCIARCCVKNSLATKNSLAGSKQPLHQDEPSLPRTYMGGTTWKPNFLDESFSCQ